MLRPGIVGLRGTMIIQLRPCMTMSVPSPSRVFPTIRPRREGHATATVGHAVSNCEPWHCQSFFQYTDINSIPSTLGKGTRCDLCMLLYCSSADAWTPQPPVDFDGLHARPMVDDSYLSFSRSTSELPAPLGFRPTDAGTTLSGKRLISAGNR